MYSKSQELSSCALRVPGLARAKLQSLLHVVLHLPVPFHPSQSHQVLAFPASQVVAFQHPIPSDVLARLGFADVGPAEGEETLWAPMAITQAPAGGVTVTGGNGLLLHVSGETGCITRYELAGGQILAEGGGGVGPCLWRAPTDNDRGGVKGNSYAARWKAAGLDRLAPEPGTLSLSAEHRGAEVVVEASWTLKPSATAGVGLVEGVGVGEVGGAHWLALKEESKSSDQRAADVEAQNSRRAPPLLSLPPPYTHVALFPPSLSPSWPFLPPPSSPLFYCPTVI